MNLRELFQRLVVMALFGAGSLMAAKEAVAQTQAAPAQSDAKPAPAAQEEGVKPAVVSETTEALPPPIETEIPVSSPDPNQAGPATIASPDQVDQEPEPEVIVAPAPDLSPEVKLMQAIEPDFVPKDDRAVQLFLLQKVVQDNEDELKKKIELKLTTRESFTRKFREDLSRFVGERTTALDTKLDASVDEAIEYYEHALKHNGDDKSFAPDALYRLGLFYFEKDEKDYFEKLALYNDAREQGRDDVPYPEENFTRTIDTYEKLIDEYPEFRHSDGVYYLLALALWYEGAFYNAVDRFQQLIAKYPQSRYVEEVWFRLAEYFYDMNEYDDAVAAYQRVASNPKAPLYDKAIYKMAWSHYQKDRFMAAIEDFIRVLEITAKESGQGGATGMRAEVTRYIVKSFAEQLLLEESAKGGVPKPKAAQKAAAKGVKPEAKPDEKVSAVKPKLDKNEKEYAEKIGAKLADRIIAYLKERKNPAYTREIFIELASQLLDEQKIEGAIRAFDQTIALDPKHQDNPRIASQIVDILQDDERLEEARARNQKLISTYGKRSRWFRSHAGDYLAQSYAREAVRDAMLALAVYHHRTGKQLKEAKNVEGAETNFKRAASLYAAYVREYPEREDTHKAIFYMAESAYELNRYRLALDAYQLLKDYPLPMPEGIRRDATFNIVFTFRSQASALQGNRF